MSNEDGDWDRHASQQFLQFLSHLEALHTNMVLQEGVTGGVCGRTHLRVWMEAALDLLVNITTPFSTLIAHFDPYGFTKAEYKQL